MRTNCFKITAIILVVTLVAGGNLLFSNQTTIAQGLDLAGIDKSIDPGDNFFGYANGGWIKATKIPEDHASYGVFTMLGEEADQRTAELIKEAGKSVKNPEARKVGDFYDAYMDETAIEARSLNPLKPELESINAIADKS